MHYTHCIDTLEVYNETIIKTAPTETQEEFRQDVLTLVGKYTGKLHSTEMLALCSYVTGQLIAMMDGASLTAEQATALVHMNIMQGNKDVIDTLAQVNKHWGGENATT